MKLFQIKYFLEIAACGSITGAAERLYISQPALSKQMNLLEEELGVKLLQRLPSGVVLTETGKEFETDCREVLKALDRAIGKAVNAGKQKNVVRIGCFEGTAVNDFLPGMLEYMRGKVSGLKIKVDRNNPVNNKAALEDDGIDMLIGLDFFPFQACSYPENCMTKKLARRKGALIYSRNSSLAKKKKLKIGDFKQETPYIISGKTDKSLSRPALNTLSMLGIDTAAVEETDNYATLMSNIRLGLGFSVLTGSVAESDPDLLKFELPDELGVDVIAVWKKDNSFISWLMEEYESMK